MQLADSLKKSLKEVTSFQKIKNIYSTNESCLRLAYRVREATVSCRSCGIEVIRDVERSNQKMDQMCVTSKTDKDQGTLGIEASFVAQTVGMQE